VSRGGPPRSVLAGAGVRLVAAALLLASMFGAVALAGPPVAGIVKVSVGSDGGDDGAERYGLAMADGSVLTCPPETWCEPVTVISADGRHAAAEQIARSALAIDPKAGSAWAALGEAQYRREVWEAAAASFELAMRRTPDGMLLRAKMASALERAGQPQAAAGFSSGHRSKAVWSPSDSRSESPIGCFRRRASGRTPC